MREYFRLLVDSRTEDLWFLGQPVREDGAVVDARLFTACRPYGATIQPLRLPVQRPGRPSRVTFGAFDMPVIDAGLVAAISAATPGDVELIPATTDEISELSIANVLPCLSCIDERRTVGDKWTEADGRPDRVGRYRTIAQLYLDSSRITREIFRVYDWNIALIVSAELAAATRLGEIEGLRLAAVT
jgi:hypothetical protein